MNIRLDRDGLSRHSGLNFRPEVTVRTIGSYELKTHLAEVLSAVEHGQTIIVTRHGKAIARIQPNSSAVHEQVGGTIKSLLAFPRSRLPRGVSVRSLIDEGRR
ncbi:MAG: type II toxin-antitoxin system prevent-host-death family antitoxin [Burkholderiales bacterium]|nr:type II toxin-antitoxin system prevent-host-death family antitoxin [Phycisphaerae bacterium]